MRTRVTLVFSLGALLAFGGCADDEPEAEMDETPEVGAVEETTPVAPGAMAFEDFDGDADTYLSREEWDVWWGDQDVGGRYAMDDAEGLSREEWSGATYDLWDADGDDAVTESEWNEGARRWFGEGGEYGAWADWDLDGDSELDANEVAEGLEREGLYDRVDGDSDAVLDDEELADWFFDLFDLDDDERLDTTEWDWGSRADFGR